MCWGWTFLVYIQQDTAQNHTNTHALFRENPGRQPGQNIINAPLSTKDHSTPQTVEIYTRNVQPKHTPYNQLTTEILGNDHRHLCTSSPLVRRFHDAPDTETEN